MKQLHVFYLVKEITRKQNKHNDVTIYQFTNSKDPPEEGLRANCQCLCSLYFNAEHVVISCLVMMSLICIYV